jgi:hypothetical protein
VTEWFAPGTVPEAECDWHRADGLALPAVYAEWLALRRGAEVSAEPVTRAAAAPEEFRILSPLDGDRYQVPAGVDARYATLPLRAAGAPAGAVRWYVDGRRVGAARWPLEPGAHRIRAVSTRGDTAEVRVEVSGGS